MGMGCPAIDLEWCCDGRLLFETQGRQDPAQRAHFFDGRAGAVHPAGRTFGAAALDLGNWRVRGWIVAGEDCISRISLSPVRQAVFSCGELCRAEYVCEALRALRIG